MFFSRRAGRVTLGVQAVVEDANQRILLIRHGYRPGWHFPGGGVERGEALHDALVRELEEETGVVARGKPETFAIYTHFDAFPGDHIVLYRVRDWTQNTVPPPNREIAQQGFYSLDALPDGITAQTRQRLLEIFSGAPVSLRW